MSALALRTSGGFSATLAKAFAIARVGAERRLAHAGELVFRSSFLGMIVFVFSELWSTVSRTTKPPSGYTVAELVWYMVVCDVLVFTSTLPQDSEIDREIRGGDVAYRLAKPVSYPLFHLAVALGDRVVRIAVCFAVGAAVALVVVGPISLRPANVTVALAAFGLGVVVDEVLTLTISLCAFWMENTLGVGLLYRRTVMIFGGVLIPIDAYPEWFARICRALPFRHLVAGPARIFVGAEGGFARVVLAELELLSGALTAMWLVYRIGTRRLEAQGG